ncbi:hypothetical protein JOC78_002603, partial [Bacillus ectoiniformans]|nr:hypothetical protein [Bacillus ectoiniformans]
GKPFQRAFKAEAGKRGFQPQSKPPVHTGGFDLFLLKINYLMSLTVLKMIFYDSEDT